MKLLGRPHGAETTLWDHFGRALCLLGSHKMSIEVSDAAQWASVVNFDDFGVLAFTILGSILELWN